MSFIGPHVPEHLKDKDAAESDEDDYTPALPPELAATRNAAGPLPNATPGASTLSPPRRAIGPAFPSAHSTQVHHSSSGPRSDPNSDSDGEVGPQPLPAHVLPTTERSGVEEFIEREARRRQHVQEAQQPPKPVRDAWMLVPPKAGDLLASLDPTKLKARQFGRGTAPAREAETSLWTETPAERQQRLADEVSGRKRRAVDAAPVEDDVEATKRRRRDAEIRQGVAAHTRHVRGPALVEVHMERETEKSKEGDEHPPAIWDHSRDMSLGGRLMDDKQRQKLLRDAKGLGDRFGTGKGGGFL